MTYKQINCQICNSLISSGGAALTAHMRCHVRNKEAIEYKQGKKLIFMRPDYNIADHEPYAKLGNDPLPGQPKNVWEIPDIKVEMPVIDPHSYFVTSGEAVKKADRLVQDVYALAAKCRAFRDKLKKTRGAKKYLETTRENGKLLVKCKEPRDRTPKDEEEDDS